jgi:hypothetical protein
VGTAQTDGRRHIAGTSFLQVSGMNFSCVYMRKFHPACRDNFVVLIYRECGFEPQLVRNKLTR